MNQISQYMFNIYHYLLNLRDTLEYTIDREHGKTLYEQRKTVLTKGIEEGSALGNFFKNNKEQGDKMTRVAQKHTKAKTRRVAQPIGQRQACIALARHSFVAQELQRGKTHLSHETK